jgi:hypothetical protein
MQTASEWAKHPRWPRLKAFLHPFDWEKEAMLRERWDSLPTELKTSN